jgi:signal transduction histidine kinase/ligand-binding sensor domain-containing protein
MPAWEVGPGKGYGGKDGVVSMLTVADGLPSNDVLALLEDEHGVVWIGTAAGLCRYRNGRLEPLEYGPPAETRHLPLSHLRAVTCLQVDREGSLWAGTRFSGLERLRNVDFSAVLEGGTSSVLEDASGALWVAGVSALARIDGGATTMLTLPDSLAPLVLAEDGANRLWVGTSEGVFRVSSGQVERVLPSLRDVAVSVLFVDAAGSVWIGGRSTGLYRWRDHALEHFTPQHGVLGSQVRAITQDSTGSLWIGTKDGGLSRLDEGGVRSLGVEDGLPSASLSALFVDAEDQVWAATRRGLARVRGTQIVTLTAEHGLPANYFYQVLCDESDHLWLTFAGGILRVARRALDDVADGRAVQVSGRVYGRRDGLRGAGLTVSFQPTAGRSRDGRLWFATGDGVAVLDPRLTSPNEIPPPVLVEEARIDDERRPVSDPVEVPSGRRELQVHYTALSFLDPSRVQFKYQLEGFDPDWVEAGTRRTAYYTNLPPGEYRFHVTACNNDGLWNEVGSSLPVVVRPRIWQTPAFRVAMVLVLAGLVTAGHRVRTRAIRARNLALQREIAERRRTEAELETRNAELEQYAYTVSHDLKSPLVTIRGYLGGLRRAATEGDLAALDRDIDRITAATDRMLELLRELLELSRVGLESSSRQDVAIERLAEEAVAQLEGGFAERGAGIEIAPDLPPVRCDPIRVREVFQNLIENALRFTAPDVTPRIEIGALEEGDRVVVFVRDNGVGIEARFHEHVFGLFNRLDARTDGTGIGLALVRRIVQAHDGRAWVESGGPGQGSTFLFTLPKGIGPPDEASR